MRVRKDKIDRHLVIAIIFVIALAGIITSCVLLSKRLKAQAASAEPSYKYYTTIRVQKGDTLWKIARTYITDDYKDINEYINEVRNINHISGDDIRYGAYITVPYYSNQLL